MSQWEWVGEGIHLRRLAEVNCCGSWVGSPSGADCVPAGAGPSFCSGSFRSKQDWPTEHLGPSGAYQGHSGWVSSVVL